MVAETMPATSDAVPLLGKYHSPDPSLGAQKVTNNILPTIPRRPIWGGRLSVTTTTTLPPRELLKLWWWLAGIVRRTLPEGGIMGKVTDKLVEQSKSPRNEGQINYR